MSRSNTPWVLLSVFLSGALLGVLWDRSALRISATPRAAEAPEADLAPKSPRGESDDDIHKRLARQFAAFEQVNRTFEMVAEAVSPSVVHIVSKKTARRDEGRRLAEVEETGSGVIARGEGTSGLYVLTNNHVVAGATAEQIDVFLWNGSRLNPSKVWLDSRSDVAVLKLDREDLPAARLGNSDEARVGTWVMALGSPFGLSHSVSQGIISGRGRHEDDLERAGVENQDFLQTDAAINPGNSGGPLVNMKGEVIGLNIAILSNGGGNEGVGFSIPINLAKWILSQFVTSGRVNRGALGIKLQPEYQPEHAKALGLESPRGAWVDSVDRGSPAERAGVRVGDVILKFKGIAVVDLNHLINLVSMAEIGAAVEILVWREGREKRLTAVVGEKDQVSTRLPTRNPTESAYLRRPERPATEPRVVLGIEVASLDAEIREQFKLPADASGVSVTRIEEGSPFAAYLQAGDVLERIGSRNVKSAEDAAEILARQGEEDHLEIYFLRAVEGRYQRLRARLP